MSIRERAIGLVRALPTESVQEITNWTWHEKYRHKKLNGATTENSIFDTHERVVKGVYALDLLNEEHATKALVAMMEQTWCPAGRIHAGAGTDSRVTLINCFVSPDIEDSMQTERNSNSKGIGEALIVAMLTQQMGGGIGMDFSTLRPDGAVVGRTNSVSTGPLPFMGMWDAMCTTIKSSGARRGAMMGVMLISHPDVRKFIVAKRTKGVFENFNVSVLVTDAFMRALDKGEDWDLKFHIPRADGKHVDVYTENGKTMYVYERLPARELWDEITRNTFEYAEPGIIFIDRVNERNNLWYCEEIHATNPCGEQPLPPNGDCNLGAINLARLVRSPFNKPTFDFAELEKVARIGVRFLDNVIDVTQFPTEEQRLEALNKRRTGLGITGLGNALQQMQIRYGSKAAIEFTGLVMETIRNAAYRESIELAKERGPFPMFDQFNYSQAAFIRSLPKDIREDIHKYGIRNSVILTIAPTGTTSMYYGNVSSGIEPTFAWKYKRKAREADGSYREFQEVYDYGYLLYKNIIGHVDGEPLPDYMVSALELTVDEHLVMQAVCQEFVDSSISKTINCPADMKFEDFQNVYTKAYEMGCKGCTTYRPSDVRGWVLSTETETKKEEPVACLPCIVVEPRPEELEGTTYKVKYPRLEHAFYITINDYIAGDQRRPFEIFINSKSVNHQEWITALTRMISAIFRRGGDVTFIVEELSQVFSSQGGAFVNKKYVPSLVALIGSTIEQHFKKIGLLQNDAPQVEVAAAVAAPTESLGEACPSCSSPTLIKQEGCGKCTSCGYSECS